MRLPASLRVYQVHQVYVGWSRGGGLNPVPASVVSVSYRRTTRTTFVFLGMAGGLCATSVQLLPATKCVL